MIRSIVLTSTALCASLSAAEYTLKAEKFEKKLTLDTVAVPTEVHGLSIAPKSWKSYSVDSFVAHGSIVKKGDVIVKFKKDAYDRQLAELESGRTSAAISFENAMGDIEQLRKSTPRKLAILKKKREEAIADYKHYQEVTVPKLFKTARFSLLNKQFSFDSANEEFVQLKKMYAEDDLTEDTEEIILKKAKIKVKFATENLKSSKALTKRAIEIMIPRVVKARAEKEHDAEYAYKKAVKSLKDALTLKELSFAKLQRADKEALRKFNEFKADGKLFTILAPVDGVLVAGEFKRGKWLPQMGAKVLKERGATVAHAVFATVIPSTAKLSFSTLVAEHQIAALKVGQVSEFSATFDNTQKFAGKVSKLESTAGLDSKWQIDFSASIPAKLALKPGMKAKAVITTYSNDKALLVPTKALKKETDGTYTVKIKGIDGKSKSSKVKVGKANGAKTEILSGLKAGQVVTYK